MYRKQLRRRRAVLALLVLSSFALLTATYGQGSGGLQQGVATIFSPLQKGADRALKPARDLVNWFDETFDARGENKKLRISSPLRKQAAAGEVALQQNNESPGCSAQPLGGRFPPGTAADGRRDRQDALLWYTRVAIDRARTPASR